MRLETYVKILRSIIHVVLAISWQNIGDTSRYLKNPAATEV